MQQTGGSPAPTPRDPAEAEARRYLPRLRRLAARLDHQAALIRNGGYNTRAEAQAGGLADEACALRWALRRIAPETECFGQLLETVRRAGRTS